MLKFKNYILFAIIIFIIAFILFLSENIINTDEFFYNSYAEDYTRDQLNNYIARREKWSWVIYAIVPIVVLIRTSLVSICLNIGVFIYNTENKIKFKHFFKIALLGEFILASVSYSKFFYFYLIKTEYTLSDIKQFYPLSYTNFLDLKNIEPWLVYPLQTINLFEIAYFFVLVYGLHKILKNKYAKSFEIVAVSYGSGLAIWLGLVMFLTLNMS
ncbi:hypothetical protein JL193_11345 [Polaribacter batillariae]|uniref:Yip1 domain-containing protein n=1 Tax=Polaribacter batillariae TaxID=2808900 RepID=A0ABX7SRG0_9FLAO|nr:hypothetical protein [Polaribacter batillariae]QTD36731.1 hypothetical protein JL193_11345 [Polaribacter batillariae]